jgi:hypothetical protein
MKESEIFCLATVMAYRAAGFEKAEGAHNVCFNEFFRAVNGTVYVGFSGKVNDTVEVVFFEKGVEKGAVAYISPDKLVSISETVIKGFKVCGVACVGKGIQVDDVPVGSYRKSVADEICTDESAATGY